MIRLMIVEDEPIERQGIKLMIENNCPEISAIAMAEDGLTAIKAARDFCPNLAMVDINMPGLSGLDTIRELKRIDPNIRFIILSSYDRFEYAHEAIKLGVEDYILKPAKISRLQQSITEIAKNLDNDQRSNKENTALIDKMQSVRPLIEKDCVYALISGPSEAYLNKVFTFLEMEVREGLCIVMDADRYSVTYIHIIKNALSRVGTACMCEQFNNKLVLFLFQNKEMGSEKPLELGDFIYMMLRHHNTQVKLGVSLVCSYAACFNKSYQQAVSALDTAKKENITVCVFREIEVLHAQSNEESKNLDALCKASLSRDTFIQALEDVAITLVYEYELDKAQEMVYQMIISFVRFIEKSGCPMLMDNIPTMKEMLDFSTPKDLDTGFRHTMMMLVETLWQHDNPYSNSLVRKALGYIGDNYCSKITLDATAEHTGVTAYYLSRLLKQHTGQSFPDLITQKRIERARELLLEDLSIKEITFMLGFNSQNYFTKTFKKWLNMTPTEYRNAYRK